MKREPLEIIVTSDGTRIGSLTPDQFREGIGETGGGFLADEVCAFNEMKAQRGEPERAEIALRKPDRKRTGTLEIRT